MHLRKFYSEKKIHVLIFLQHAILMHEYRINFVPYLYTRHSGESTSGKAIRRKGVAYASRAIRLPAAGRVSRVNHR